MSNLDNIPKGTQLIALSITHNHGLDVIRFGGDKLHVDEALSYILNEHGRDRIITMQQTQANLEYESWVVVIATA